MNNYLLENPSGGDYPILKGLIVAHMFTYCLLALLLEDEETNYLFYFILFKWEFLHQKKKGSKDIVHPTSLFLLCLI